MLRLPVTESIPQVDTIKKGTGKFRSRKIRVAKSHKNQLSSGEICSGQIGVVEVAVVNESPGQIGLAEIRSSEVHARQIRFREIGAREICPSKVHGVDLRSSKIRIAQSNSREVFTKDLHSHVVSVVTTTKRGEVLRDSCPHEKRSANPTTQSNYHCCCPGSNSPNSCAEYVWSGVCGIAFNRCSSATFSRYAACLARSSFRASSQGSQSLYRRFDVRQIFLCTRFDENSLQRGHRKCSTSATADNVARKVNRGLPRHAESTIISASRRLPLVNVSLNGLAEIV